MVVKEDLLHLLESPVPMATITRLRAVPVLILLTIMLTAIPARADKNKSSSPTGLADGAGLWVNLWNYPGDEESYTKNIAGHGIRNLFVQTSRSNTEAIKHPQKLGRLIEAAHRHQIHVIAWSFAELADPLADADKMVAAALFKSPAGQGIDAIAPNLEGNLSAAQVTAYCESIEQRLGRGYPKLVVVFSPLNRAKAVATTPWQLLARYFDVLAPMTYWSGKLQMLEPYAYAKATASQIRKLTGRPDVEIHLIGDGMGTSSAEFTEFLTACRDAEVAGASLYPNHQVTAAQLTCLSTYRRYFPANSRFRLAAFRQLLATGAIENPASGDPSEKISRGAFYRLAARMLLDSGQPGADSSIGSDAHLHEKAMHRLAARALIGVVDPGILAEPMPVSEAFELLARAVESPERSGMASHWLTQPALASQPHRQVASARPLSYLHAAQIVLEARAGLR